MFYIIIATILISTALPVVLAGSTVGCGRQGAKYEPLLPRARIINGALARAHTWPWIISIQTNNSQLCGGALLRIKDGVEQSDLVLTAAHCVYPVKNKTELKWYSIVAGNHYQTITEEGEIRVPVQDFLMHEKYDKPKKLNDMAMLKLAKPVPFSETIRPICLPAKGANLPVNQLCVGAGWGRHDPSKQFATADGLQQLPVKVHELKVCKDEWEKYFDMDTMMCAGVLDRTSSLCHGDSGGPLVCQENKDAPWVLQGVANFVGGKDCNSKAPPVYARVSVFTDWIQSKIKQMSSVQ